MHPCPRQSTLDGVHQDVKNLRGFDVIHFLHVHQDQAELVAERVEIIGEFVMVETRTAMQDNEWITLPALLDKKAGITDVYELR